MSCEVSKTNGRLKTYCLMKKNVYGWIILIILLVPACIFTAFGINNLLFFLSETPMYSNMYRFDDLEMSVQLPEGWKFLNDEDVIGLTNTENTEFLYITETKSASTMDIAKTMFKLSFDNSHEGEIDYKEGTIDGKTEVYYVTYLVYSDFYAAGVIGNNDIYAQFTYVTKLSNSNMSPLSSILSSIKFNRVVDVNATKSTAPMEATE